MANRHWRKGIIDLRLLGRILAVACVAALAGWRVLSMRNGPLCCPVSSPQPVATGTAQRPEVVHSAAGQSGARTEGNAPNTGAGARDAAGGTPRAAPGSAFRGSFISLPAEDACRCVAGGRCAVEKRLRTVAETNPDLLVERIDPEGDPAEASELMKICDLLTRPAFVLLDGEGKVIYAADYAHPQYEEMLAWALRAVLRKGSSREK